MSKHVPDRTPATTGPPDFPILPHDPVSWGENQKTCRECEVYWPCETRKQQRQAIKEIVNYTLRADLYERVPAHPEDAEGARWTSPLGWSVWYSYGKEGLAITIRDPKGELYAATTNGGVDWVEENLP